MGLEEVKKEILDEAQQEADRIIGEGEKEAESIVSQAKQKAEEYREDVKADTERVLDTVERRALGTASFDVKKHTLDEKNDIIDEVMENVVERLRSESESKRKKLLQALLKKAKDEIDVGTVYVNKQDKKLLTGVDVKVADIKGGLIAETKDGSVSVDLSFDEIIDEIRKNELEDINQRLFG